MLQEIRTGCVRVVMKDGADRMVRAESFGEAASKVTCPSGHIVRFEWVDEGQC